MREVRCVGIPLTLPSVPIPRSRTPLLWAGSSPPPTARLLQPRTPHSRIQTPQASCSLHTAACGIDGEYVRCTSLANHGPLRASACEGHHHHHHHHHTAPQTSPCRRLQGPIGKAATACQGIRPNTPAPKTLAHINMSRPVRRRAAEERDRQAEPTCERVRSPPRVGVH